MANQIPIYLKELLFEKWNGNENIEKFINENTTFNMETYTHSLNPSSDAVVLDFSDEPNNKEIINTLFGGRDIEKDNNVDIVYMYDGNDTIIDYKIFKNNQNVYKLKTVEQMIFPQKNDYIHQFNPCNFERDMSKTMYYCNNNTNVHQHI